MTESRAKELLSKLGMKYRVGAVVDYERQEARFLLFRADGMLVRSQVSGPSRGIQTHWGGV